MIYKNIEIYNTDAIREQESGAVRWLRMPEAVAALLETDEGKRMAEYSTGVELRFVMKSDTVRLRMRTTENEGVFHVFRGSIQGGWPDHEENKTVGTQWKDFVINKSDNLPVLENISDEFSYPFSPEVVRVIFDRGSYELLDVTGDVVPPMASQLPEKTLFCYGSSITHGSNSIDASHSWASVLAHNLKMDCRNLGMAGCCCMEPGVADYIAGEGEKNKWDIALLELGINVLAWEEETFVTRVTYCIQQVAQRNADKPVYVISPFYCNDDYHGGGKAKRWRALIEQIVDHLSLQNVTYINGLDVLGDMSFISADEVHPNIYGVARIAQRMQELIEKTQS